MHAPGDVVVVSGEAGAISIGTGSGALSVFEPATGAIVDVNDAWVRLYGYSKEEARTMRVTDVSAEPNATRDAVARATDAGGAQIDVRWHRRRDGLVFPVRLTAGLLRVGERTLMFALMHDITERVRSAEALARSEESYRTLVESVPDGVIVHRDGFVVFMNPAARRMLGYESLEQLANKPAIELVHPDDREAVLERVQKLVVEEQPAVAREERLVRADGSVLWAEVAAIPTTFDGQRAVLAIVHDLTSRKRMEAQLVTTDRLASLGRLAASVGHEINNPLSYVLGNVELLRRTMNEAEPAVRDRFQEGLAAIETGAARVRDIVRDLKTLSRSDPDELAPVDVNRVVDMCAEMAAHEIRQRARLVRELGRGVVANAQEGRLGQIIINLLVNAGQAIAADAKDNEVRITTRRGDDGTAIIEVRDTGVGIPPEVRDRIFEPFFTTRAPGGGTGLGLSICHHLVTSFGGTIEFEANEPRGTCFRVTLPEPRAAAVSVNRASAPPQPLVAPRARVLVIEDEPLLASVLRHTLSAHDVTIATGCAAAIKAVTDAPAFDLVLCDVLLGDGTAADVVAHLREHHPELMRCLIFMTGGAATPQVATFLATAKRPVLEKPFSITQLEALVREMLAGP